MMNGSYKEQPNFPTFAEVCADVARVHPLGARTLRADIKLLGIKPVGRRQRPNLYPTDTAARILAARGHVEVAA